MLKGYDIDGVLTAGVELVFPCVVISGRTFAEYDDFVKEAAKVCPVYIRGSGAYGDRKHAGKFKAQMINLLGVEEFYEDDPMQVQIIQGSCFQCKVVMVGK